MIPPAAITGRAIVKITALKDAEFHGLTIPDYPITYGAGKALAAAGKAKGEGGFGAQRAGQGAPLARAMPAADLIGVLRDELAAARGGGRPAQAA